MRKGLEPRDILWLRLLLKLIQAYHLHTGGEMTYFYLAYSSSIDQYSNTQAEDKVSQDVTSTLSPRLRREKMRKRRRWSQRHLQQQLYRTLSLRRGHRISLQHQFPSYLLQHPNLRRVQHRHPIRSHQAIQTTKTKMACTGVMIDV